MTKLVQIYAGGIEELWNFPDAMEESTIIALWKQYEDSESDSFENFMEEFHEEIECERVFTEEIYIV